LIGLDSDLDGGHPAVAAIIVFKGLI